MKIKIAPLAGILLFSLSLTAQDPAVINMDQEPHHHLTVQNDDVKIFNVQVSPGDSIILHKHDQDTVAIAVGEQLVTVGIPGKPDVHQKNADAQVRLQRSGYMHSTRVDGNTPYHTVAVELLRPQTDFRNVCAEILAGQPLNCPATAGKESPAFASQVLLESAETRVLLVRVHPRQSMKPVDFPFAAVIVALDPATIPSGTAKRPDKMMQPGDFVWIENGHGRAYQNAADTDARFIEIMFPRV